MFSFIRLSLSDLKLSPRKLPSHELHCLLFTHFLSSDSSKLPPKPSSVEEKDSSFAVNYLVKTLGFLPERAAYLSKYVNFNKADKPDAVIAFFKNQGFSESQVRKLVNARPRLVMYDTELLSQKVEFLLSRGLPKPDVQAMLISSPSILAHSLEKTIIPCFDWFEHYLGSKKAISPVFCKTRRSLNVQRYIVPNIERLRNVGVPENNIRNYLRCHSKSCFNHPNRFGEAVDEVTKMGIDPVKSHFLIAIYVILALSRSSWDEKIEVYKQWGCSEDEVLAAFAKQPWCMSLSKDKIDGIIGYFVNEMGWSVSELLQKPNILTMSLNKRIVPRCSIYQALMSKGLLRRLPSLSSLLTVSEVAFRKRWVEPYENVAPELSKLYQEKLGLAR